MRVYPNPFAYLNGETAGESLRGRSRPIIVTEGGEYLSFNPLLLKSADNVHEIGFPYVNFSDWQNGGSLQTLTVFIVDGVHHKYTVSDEVLDGGGIDEEEVLKEHGDIVDNLTASLIQVYVGLFASGRIIDVVELPSYMETFNIEEATLPIIVSLERKYDLTRKLREITPKLRHQLRRQAELIPIGRIQEMDSYCLRDYTRRPGRTPEEKAGSRQALLGVQRYQDFNTLENKFLAYFAGKLLHLECFRYENGGKGEYEREVRKLRQTIEVFQETARNFGVSVSRFQFTKPNYVLQGNPIYRSFYRSYLDYIHKRTENQRLWSGRNHLLGDTLYLCLITALLKFRGVTLPPNVILEPYPSPNSGHYLPSPLTVEVKIFLKDVVYVVHCRKSTRIGEGDYSLEVEIHDLNSPELEISTRKLPIWVFWYEPDAAVLASANEYLRRIEGRGLIFYLRDANNRSFPESSTYIHKNIRLIRISDSLETGFGEVIDFLGNGIIKNWLEDSLWTGNH